MPLVTFTLRSIGCFSNLSPTSLPLLSLQIAKSSSPSGPSLVQVTKAALQAITDDLETLISLTVDPATADYAVITGVQIHSGNQVCTLSLNTKKQ